VSVEWKKNGKGGGRVLGVERGWEGGRRGGGLAGKITNVGGEGWGGIGVRGERSGGWVEEMEIRGVVRGGVGGKRGG